MHSTNYFNTLILVSPDGAASEGQVPARAGLVADLQYLLLIEKRYQMTSDDVIFSVFADRKNIDAVDREAARRDFFSKEQACLRASPLVKTQGWGVHHDENGHIALVGMETSGYQELVAREGCHQSQRYALQAGVNIRTYV